jgi:L-fuculose-phosphate aldolase
MEPFVAHHNALLMSNHGAVAYGKDLWEAWDRMETLEHTAKIAILARQLGNVNDLPKESIEKLIHIREKAGYLDKSARCQSCGYLEDTNITCEMDGHNHEQKISLTREDLLDLISQAAGLQ